MISLITTQLPRPGVLIRSFILVERFKLLVLFTNAYNYYHITPLIKLRIVFWVIWIRKYHTPGYRHYWLMILLKRFYPKEKNVEVYHLRRHYHHHYYHHSHSLTLAISLSLYPIFYYTILWLSTTVRLCAELFRDLLLLAGEW